MDKPCFARTDQVVCECPGCPWAEGMGWGWCCFGKLSLAYQLGEALRPFARFAQCFNGKNMAHSYESLDAAQVGCVAYKNDGPNTMADAYFMRMIAGGRS